MEAFFDLCDKVTEVDTPFYFSYEKKNSDVKCVLVYQHSLKQPIYHDGVLRGYLHATSDGFCVI